MLKVPQSYFVAGLSLALSALLGSSAAFAQNTNDPLIEQREAAHWLDRIQSAAQKSNYAGTFVYQHGNSMQTSRIAHTGDLLGNEYERIEMLDGRPREMLRHNDEVVTLHREQRLRVQEKRELKDTFPALLASSKVEVMEAYAFRKLGLDRVAGHECQILSLEPRDAMRYGYRLCADKQTGLLLRAQTTVDGSKVLEQIAFSQVQMGIPSEKQKVLSAMKTNQGWAQHTVVSQKANLSQQGWVLEPTVKGFQKLKELRRPLTSDMPTQQRNAKAQTANPASEVYQVVYSDGLAGVSVFIEPVVDKKARKEGLASRGATNVLMKRQGAYWVTVVGEVPMATVKQFGQAIERKAGQ